jgi:hypothetical protein
MIDQPNISSIPFILFVVIAFIHIEAVTGQDVNTLNFRQQDRSQLKLSKQSITIPQLDTVRPTMIKYGKGLMYYKYLYLGQADRGCSNKGRGNDKSVIVKSTYTDIELEILKQNLLFIEDQYQIQIKEWIRKEKLDLNLGEAIKGFYQTPVF